MVSFKVILTASLFVFGAQFIRAGDTIACTVGGAECSGTTKCMAVGTSFACVEACTVADEVADCGAASTCVAATDADGGATLMCPLLAQQCLTDAECAAADATTPLCNVYTLTCVADPTATATTTVADTTTTTVVTTTTSKATASATTVAACADKVTGGSNDCAALASYCTNSVYLSMMKDKCPKTCGYCTSSSSSGSGSGTSSSTCADQVTGGSNDCASLASYCKNTVYLTLMKEKCPKTCGYCTTSSSSTSSGTSSSGSTSTCVDTTTDCSAKSYLCTNSLYKDLMKSICAATCNYC